jgi:hypothetical protein
VSSRSGVMGAPVSFGGTWAVVDTCTTPCTGEKFGVTMVVSQKAGVEQLYGIVGPQQGGRVAVGALG